MSMISQKLLLESFFMTVAVTVAATSNCNSSSDCYMMEGPGGLNVSVQFTSGTISVFRTLDYSMNPSTTTVITTPPEVEKTPEEENSTMEETTSTTRATTISPPPKIIRTGKVMLQISSLRQSNNDSNATKVTSLEDCVFNKVKEIIDANQSICTTFACRIGPSSLEKEICLLPVNNQSKKSVVQINYRLSGWIWCRVGDCKDDDLEMIFKLSIRPGDFITKSDDQTSNYTTYHLGYPGAPLRFWKSVNFFLIVPQIWCTVTP